jgi:hypothetical protein
MLFRILTDSVNENKMRTKKLRWIELSIWLKGSLKLASAHSAAAGKL